MGQYDVRDNQGRKIGTIESSHDGGCTELMVMILAPIVIIGLIGWGAFALVSHIVHPTMSSTFFPQNVSGGGGDTLNPGDSVEFDINAPSDDQYTVNIVQDFHATYHESIIVNNIDVADPIGVNGFDFTVHLHEGANTIKIINTTSNQDTSLPDVDVHGIYVQTA